ncbi:tetratricopeptide repeat protein 12-like [Copidosoma floridanum]|uniref:tetratricopeptide repeat protein 12-like n=1 Tax=Copidosoma floridanum TaxID=29053 RepID=UPI0006C95E28|nr:tetratricopeptide repeat protein 12-like [Copidosoma floridanum]
MNKNFLFDSKDIAKKSLIMKQDINVNNEEFHNFMHRVTRVEKIVKQLTSPNLDDQKHGIVLADEILKENVTFELSDTDVSKVKTSRTIINKYLPENLNSNKMCQEVFKRCVERDVQARAENRKICNERADTYKRIGNGAFHEAKYEKAVTYFTKALEQRKDSAVLWNNRALSYMALGLYEKALADCERALKINDNNIKALLNSAKCYKLLNCEDECEEFLKLARKSNPRFSSYISEFEKNLESDGTTEFTVSKKGDIY